MTEKNLTELQNEIDELKAQNEVLMQENDKLLEDDIVTIYGEGTGEYTYESVSGQSITVPAFIITYVDFH